MSSDYGLFDGRYRLLTELGRGAFGSVHRASQVVLGIDLREVAVKMFHADAITATNLSEKMNDAVQLLDLLSKLGDWKIRQHFLTIYDLGLTRDTPPRGFIVMELVEGGNLDRRIRELGRFTPAGCLHYLRQIARAVAFMHRQSPPMVHSDLKPENILLFRGVDEDLVKIGDFGLAGLYWGPFGGPGGGTLSYLAPELFFGLSTSPAADVFSLGLIAFKMLTGANPYDDVGSTLNREQLDHALLNELHIKARSTPLALDRAAFFEGRSGSSESQSLETLIDVVNRMLHPAPEKRYCSAIEVSEELESIARGGFGGLIANDLAAGADDSPLDKLTVLQQKFQHRLAEQCWDEATAVIHDIEQTVKSNGGKPDLPYRLRADLLLYQAKALPAIAPALRTQAVNVLLLGRQKCPDRGAQERLDVQIKELKGLMGIV